MTEDTLKEAKDLYDFIQLINNIKEFKEGAQQTGLFLWTATCKSKYGFKEAYEKFLDDYKNQLVDKFNRL